MFSMSIHSGIKGTLTCPSFPSQNPIVGPFKASSSLKQKPYPQKFPTIFYQQTRPSKRIYRLYASATLEAEAEVEVEEEAVVTEIPADDSSSTVPFEADESDYDVDKRKLEKPKLVLKFIWMEKNIGLGLDQEISGHGRVPLSPYFFWPRKDAWEELKTTLESKPWITQKTMIILLNQATDIINLWQQSGGNLT